MLENWCWKNCKPEYGGEGEMPLPPRHATVMKITKLDASCWTWIFNRDLVSFTKAPQKICPKNTPKKDPSKYKKKLYGKFVEPKNSSTCKHVKRSELWKNWLKNLKNFTLRKFKKRYFLETFFFPKKCRKPFKIFFPILIFFLVFNFLWEPVPFFRISQNFQKKFEI